LLPCCAARARAQQSHEQHLHEQQQQPPAQTGEKFTRTSASYDVPDVTLVDMNGARVQLATALAYDGPVFLQFIFTTCPTICPVMSGTLSSAQEKLGADAARARMISISIDPEQDTPERLREYARKFKAGPHWTFLTGDLEKIVAVQKSFDAYRGNKMRHEPLTFMRAATGKPWLRLDGLLSATQLLDEYRRLTSQ
ncbi:MAG TPA: SCO family protein, partial [Pyrinomonadaceae bacterium]|nr:SCO family protein [Pyrinomonadaceae bacterium]